jgi:type VI secretion system protein ImpL
MKPKLKTGLIAAIPMAVFFALGWTLASALGLHGWGFRLFWIGFAFLGAVIGGVIFWFLNRRRPGRTARAVSPGAENLEARLAAVKKRLATARRPHLDRLPLVLLLGPPGSAKSSSVVGSDVAVEQLTGDSPRDGIFPATESINAWYSDGTVLLEAGADLIQDPSLWPQLLRRIVPRKLLAAILTGRGQAPRAAVVCFSSEGLVGGDAASDVSLSWARALRTRLLEMSEKLGVRVPVYVLFTKADLVPSFPDYFWNATEEESGRVLGCTLPHSSSDEAASYWDRQSRVLARAFEDLFRSLALKRPKYLDQEVGTVRAARAYEFPREFRKLTRSASQFLLELCKPSQLQVSPFLRGFYFVGRQELPVQGRAMPRVEESSTFTGPAGATAIFDPRAMEAHPRPPSYAPSTPSGVRHRWLFLSRVLRDVVLRDDIAVGMMRGGTRVSSGRRLLLGTVTFVVLLLLIPFLLAAFIHNRGIQSRVTETLAAVEEIRDWSGGSAEAVEALQRLEILRANADTLWTYETQGPPLRFGGWLGLYRGSELHPVTLQRYVHRFSSFLLSPALASMEAELRNLPAHPGPESDYQATYDLLRAYLMATRHPERSEADYLSAALSRQWHLLQDEESRALARTQFDFFAERLLPSDWFPGAPAEEGTVARTRQFLGRMGQAQPFYVSLLSQANQRHHALGIPNRIPSSPSAALQVGRDIPGAFSAEGHRFVQDQLSRPEGLLQAEEWVLGEVSPPNPEMVARQIDSLYSREYPQQWEDLLARTTVTSFRNLADATRKLEQLTGEDSPLALLLWVMSNNVFEGPETARARFAPLNAFLMWDSAGFGGYTEPAGQYFHSLDGLRYALEEMEKVQGPAQQEKGTAILAGEVVQALNAVDQIRRSMGMDPQGRYVSGRLENLLRQPIDQADGLINGLIRGVEPRELNRWGDDFCTEYNNRVGSKYPFRSGSSEEPTLDDLAAIFQRGSGQGQLWNLGDRLQPYMERSGPIFQGRPGSPVTLNPRFLEFFASAVRFSEAIYPEGATGPRVAFSILPSIAESSPGVESVTLRVDRMPERVCTPMDCSTLPVSWEGLSTSEVELTARVDGEVVRVVNLYRGTWAPFRLFADATGWGSTGEQRHTVRWPVIVRGTEKWVSAVVIFDGPPVFATVILSSLQCVPRIAVLP